MNTNCTRRTFLRQFAIGTAGLGFYLSTPESLLGAGNVGRRLPRSAPEREGVNSQGLLDFFEAIDGSKHEFHTMMVVRHGKVIAEGYWKPYRAEAPQMMYSMSKSFTSTAIGFAVAEGRLSVHDPVMSFFPDDLPAEPSDTLKSLRIKDLLTMAVGHAQDSTGSLWAENNWVRKFLSLPIPNAPGSAFLYNSGATYMLSGIIHQVTGQNLVSYLTPRLFEPLGIRNVTWETCPRGINTGGWGLKIQTEGLAKFGQLFLQNGRWQRKELLPQWWIQEATTFKIQQPSPDLDRAKQESDWHQGYCYQFWRSRHNSYRGDGAFGQYTLVMPEKDAVVAITSETPDMQGVLNLVWKHLLPAMKEGPLRRNSAAQSKLKEKLQSSMLPLPSGQLTAPAAKRINQTDFKVATNESGIERVSLRFEKRSCLFTLGDRKGAHHVRCGLGEWLDGETDMPGTPPRLTQGPLPPVSKVAAAGTWKDPDTFNMVWRYYETPHHDKVTCRFDGDSLRVEFLDSMTAMNPDRKDKRPPLQATAST